MLDKGADTTLINKQCFRTISREGVELSKMLYRNIKYLCNGKVAYVILNEKDFKKTKTSYQDASNFSNILCSIEGVKFGCSITERNKKFSFSIRSVIGYSANKLASLLGGGGHEQAAGATIDSKQKIVEEIELVIENERKFQRVFYQMNRKYKIIVLRMKIFN